MRLHEIEFWALDVVERVRRGQPIEDDRVEAKATFTESTEKAARRIAGHANASRGAPILWLFGVDESAGEVPGVDRQEYAGWWESVAAWFDEVAPHVQMVNVRSGDATVVALLVSADRAPFVVRNPVHGTPGGGAVEFEVPWRAATGIRSAHRSELMLALVPALAVPAFEMRAARVVIHPPQGDIADAKPQVDLMILLYVEPQSEGTLIFPNHRAKLMVRGLQGEVLAEFGDVSLFVGGLDGFSGFRRDSPATIAQTIERGAEQLIVRGPGLMKVHQHSYLDVPFVDDPSAPITLAVELNAVRSPGPVVLEIPMTVDTKRTDMHDKPLARWIAGELEGGV